MQSKNEETVPKWGKELLDRVELLGTMMDTYYTDEMTHISKKSEAIVSFLKAVQEDQIKALVLVRDESEIIQHMIAELEAVVKSELPIIQRDLSRIVENTQRLRQDTTDLTQTLLQVRNSLVGLTDTCERILEKVTEPKE